jgi:hypothetical protein
MKNRNILQHHLKHHLSILKVKAIMSAKARYHDNKDYICENLNLNTLFEYLVVHKHMKSEVKDKILNALSKSDKTLTTFANQKFCEHFLSRYIDDNDSVVDIPIFTSLMATGQRDIVLKIFPDFIATARNVAINRIVKYRTYFADIIDIDSMMNYVKDNDIVVPDYDCIKKTKLHPMKTRSDRMCNLRFIMSGLIYNVKKDDFDFNTDPFFKALHETGQHAIVDTIFPARNLCLTPC